MQVKIKLLPRADEPTKLVDFPEYATMGSAAFDLQANVEERVKLFPEECRVIPTGLKLSMPDNLALLILPRSGRSLEGFTVINSPGLVDSDFRGELGIIIRNSSDEVRVISPQMKLAQAMFTTAEKPRISVVEDLESTSRGKSGFGSTDKSGIHGDIV